MTSNRPATAVPALATWASVNGTTDVSVCSRSARSGVNALTRSTTPSVIVAMAMTAGTRPMNRLGSAANREREAMIRWSSLYLLLGPAQEKLSANHDRFFSRERRVRSAVDLEHRGDPAHLVGGVAGEPAAHERFE